MSMSIMDPIQAKKRRRYRKIQYDFFPQQQ